MHVDCSHGDGFETWNVERNNIRPNSPLERGRAGIVRLRGVLRRSHNTPLHPSQEGNRTTRRSFLILRTL
jgi:hypothetical protein